MNKSPKSPRNPNWSQDEVILALAFFVEHEKKIPSKNSQEIMELSFLMKKVAQEFHKCDNESLRNPTGITRNLDNFKKLLGGTAGERVSKTMKETWKIFEYRPKELVETADAIKINIKSGRQLDELDDRYAIAYEGKVLSRCHVTYERNQRIVASKKEEFRDLHDGKLFCEACHFDFAVKYPLHGEGYIECHHIKSLSKTNETLTKLEDLALVCSNCHVMIHYKRPWLSMDQLQNIINGTASK